MVTPSPTATLKMMFTAVRRLHQRAGGALALMDRCLSTRCARLGPETVALKTPFLRMRGVDLGVSFF